MSGSGHPAFTAPIHTFISDSREDSKSTESRYLRGGSWGSRPIDARAAYRDHDDPVSVGNGVGFRLVRSAPGS